MTLRHLQILISVVDCGSMTSAAEKLFISQSSVSQAIAELESEYSTRLFERLNKRLYITDAGRELVNYARNIISLYRDMDEHMKRMKPTIRIGATFSVSASILSEIIRRYNVQFPSSRTEVTVKKTSELENMLLRNELDLAIVEGVINAPELTVSKIIDDDLYLICSPQHPFFYRSEIDIKELEGEPFVQRESGSNTRYLLEKQLIQHNVSVQNKWICNNAEAIKSAVLQGQGLAIMSGRTVKKEYESNDLNLITIRNVPLRRTFSLVYHSGKFLTDYLKAFISITKDSSIHANCELVFHPRPSNINDF